MLRTCVMSALVTAILSVPAAAQNLISAKDPATLVTALQDLGFKAQLTKDSVGDPMIKSAATGVNFSIFFYGCSENLACQDLQFSAGFNTPDESDVMMMNEWNNKYTLGTAMVDDEKDPIFQHFVAGVEDMTAASFKRLVDRWENALGDFTFHIDW